jgi:hypothetical protein
MYSESFKQTITLYLKNRPIWLGSVYLSSLVFLICLLTHVRQRQGWQWISLEQGFFIIYFFIIIIIMCIQFGFIYNYRSRLGR